MPDQTIDQLTVRREYTGTGQGDLGASADWRPYIDTPQGRFYLAPNAPDTGEKGS